MSVYLDYNASAPIDPRVLDSMIDAYRNHIGNADSRTHDFGEGVRVQVDHARKKVADLMGAEKNEIFFTSGATESNNIAILGLKEYGEKSGKKHIITTAIEHKAVIQAAKHLQGEGFDIELVFPDESGSIDVQDLIGRVRDDTLLVSVMHVNNETGVIQPVDQIGSFLEERKILFHIDATQSCGKLVSEIRGLKYDMMSISAHKIHGPQGVGALILRRKRYRLPPVKSIMYGGLQEGGIRPGTLPTALIVGFGKACEIIEKEYERNTERELYIKEKFIEIIDKSGVQYKVNGNLENSIPTTLNISFLGVSSEALMISTKQYCGVSNGSACTSGSYSHSHVLSAMGLSDERIESAIRISWGADCDWNVICEEFRKLVSTVVDIVGL